MPGRGSISRPLGFLSYAIVVVAVGLLFGLGVTDGYLNGDDVAYTSGCPFVRDGFTYSGLCAAFSDFCYCAIWMPVTFCTYMADISFLGGGWRVHHAVNVFFHAVNACLFLAFLKMLMSRLLPEWGCRTTWACVFGALLWALHPQRVEAVTWIASRKEELWTLFALSGLMVWIAFVERGGVLRYLSAMAFFLLACLSKPTALCLPLLACLVAAVLKRRFAFRIRCLLPLLAVSAAVGLLAIHSQSNPTGMARADVFAVGLGWRVLNAAVSLGLYIWHVIWPAGVHVDYRAVFGGCPLDGGLGLSVLAASVLALSAGFLYAKGDGTRKILVLSSLWFVLGVSPTLGVLGYVNGDHAYADRYAYLPGMAFSFLTACILMALSSVRYRGIAAFSIAAVVLVVESLAAVPVIRSFESDYLAFSRALRADPGHWRALRIVGNEYCARMNRMDEGVGMLRRSLRIRGSQQTADSLAYILAHRGTPGDFDEVRRLGSAFLRNPSLDRGGMMLDALGVVFMREGDYVRAAQCLAASLKAPMRGHETRYSRLNLGLCLANLGRDAESVRILEPLSRDSNASVRARAAEAVLRIRSGCPRIGFGWE